MENELKLVREIEIKLIEIFDSEGFEEVKVPMIEFSKTLFAQIPIVREDFTSEIIRRYGEGDFCYRGGVFRITPFGKPKEMYQIGCEIIRKANISKNELIKCSKILNSVLRVISELTSREITVTLGHYGLTKRELGDISHIFFKKNISEIERIVKREKLSKKKAEAFFGVFDDIKQLEKLVSIPDDLKTLSKSIDFRKIYNLAEIADKDYYNGVLFSAYADTKKFLVGGRYEIYGYEGIGFCIDVFAFV